jgi:hypothetical protein
MSIFKAHSPALLMMTFNRIRSAITLISLLLLFTSLFQVPQRPALRAKAVELLQVQKCASLKYPVPY